MFIAPASDQRLEPQTEGRGGGGVKGRQKEEERDRRGTRESGRGRMPSRVDPT